MVGFEGMSALVDVGIHEVTGIYAMMMMGLSGIFVYIFAIIFYNMGDSWYPLQCDLTVDKAAYDGIQDIVKLIKDQKSCLDNIQKLFDIIDLNDDGIIQRCEDAKFQHASGSSQEYALKFSNEFSRATANLICYEDYKS